jgi:hypothetical protein
MAVLFHLWSDGLRLQLAPSFKAPAMTAVALGLISRDMMYILLFPESLPL